LWLPKPQSVYAVASVSETILKLTVDKSVDDVQVSADGGRREANVVHVTH
jgi:hypothetical protein